MTGINVPEAKWIGIFSPDALKDEIVDRTSFGTRESDGMSHSSPVRDSSDPLLQAILGVLERIDQRLTALS